MYVQGCAGYRLYLCTTRKMSETNIMSSMLKQRKIQSIVNFLVLWLSWEVFIQMVMPPNAWKRRQIYQMPRSFLSISCEGITEHIHDTCTWIGIISTNGTIIFSMKSKVGQKEYNLGCHVITSTGVQFKKVYSHYFALKCNLFATKLDYDNIIPSQTKSLNTF